MSSVMQWEMEDTSFRLWGKGIYNSILMLQIPILNVETAHTNQFPWIHNVKYRDNALVIKQSHICQWNASITSLSTSVCTLFGQRYFRHKLLIAFHFLPSFPFFLLLKGICQGFYCLYYLIIRMFICTLVAICG